MNDNPKVSIIITVYNKSIHLENCILSILNQTYDNIEIIIIDDCSTDDSRNIINKFKDCNKITIIYNEHNMGCYASRNIGIKHSNGDIIAFQDADDYSISTRIEEQVNYMLKYNLLMCGCNISRTKLPILKITNEKQFLKNIIKYSRRIYFGYATLLIKRELFDKYGYFIEKRKGMDMEYGERILFYECGIIFTKNMCSWSFFHTKNNNIYRKINKILYICPKMNKYNITNSIQDDSFLRDKLWRKNYL